jgi:HlyD family secretion protein
MKTLLVVVVIIAGLAGGGYWYWKNRAADAPDYKTATVTRGDLVQTVTATGQVNPMTNVTVGSQVSGIIRKLYADYNSVVTNGQLLAEIDPATYAAQVAQATADMANAKAALALARVTLARDGTLLTNKIVSQADFDAAAASCQQAEAMVMIKQATLDQDSANLAYTKIYTPIDGLVLSRNVDVGQTVAASFSAPTLFVIANDISKMQIDALVSEADIGTIESNQTVNFTVDAYPGRSFHGTVFQIRNFPQTNQNVVCYDTMISVDNSDRKLRPGMTANVAIVTAEQDGSLRIPNAALRYRPSDVPDASAQPVAAAGPGGPGGAGDLAAGQRRGDGSGGRSGGPGGGGGRGRGRAPKTIYLLADDPGGKGKIAKPVQIRTGIGDGVYTEVTDGLKEGDEVITSQNNLTTSAAPAAPASPFGGGGRRF